MAGIMGNFVMRHVLPAFAAAAIFATAPATAATTISSGTVSSALLFSPTVTIGDTSTFGAPARGESFQITATGGFAGAQMQPGWLNGVIAFSRTVGASIDQTLTDLFVFTDGIESRDTFNFSAYRVQTIAFSNIPGISTAGSLVLSGFTRNVGRRLADTASELTISFNSTGGSSYSSSASLATVSAVPEPTTWAMMLLGMSLVAGTARYRRRSTVARLG
jgi:hypothetical protein